MNPQIRKKIIKHNDEIWMSYTLPPKFRYTGRIENAIRIIKYEMKRKKVKTPCPMFLSQIAQKYKVKVDKLIVIGKFEKLYKYLKK